MTLALEREVIETYFAANWTSTPFGRDGGSFEPTYGMEGRPGTSVSMSIINGQMMNESIGRAQNVYITPAHILFSIYYDGAKGSQYWRSVASDLVDLFFNVTLDANAAVVTTANQAPFLRFCPPQLGDNRYVQYGPLMTEAPFSVKPINIPFIRYEIR